MNQDIEQYIEEQLQEFGPYMVQELTGALTRMHLNDSLELSNSIRTEVDKIRLQLIFDEYGRMRDMGAGKGGRGKQIESVAGNKKQWQGRKPANWYSKTAYGMLDGLIEKISFGYMEKSVESFKEALQ